MLGGLGSDGVVIGGRGRDTGTVMGLGASVTGAGRVVAGLLSALAEVDVLAPDAGAEFTAETAGLTPVVTGAATEVVDAVVEAAVAGLEVVALTAEVDTGADPAAEDDPAAGVDAIGADVTGALAGITGRTPAVLATGVAGSVGVGMVAGDGKVAGFETAWLGAAGVVAVLALPAGGTAGAGSTIGDFCMVVGGRASGTLG